MTAQEQARADAATHAARRQAEMDRVAALTPEQKAREQAEFIARIRALGGDI